MSKCPFWSTGKEKIECSSSCPMNDFFSIKDNCPFKEYLEDSGIKIKEIDEGNYFFDEEIQLHNISHFKSSN